MPFSAFHSIFHTASLSVVSVAPGCTSGSLTAMMNGVRGPLPLTYLDRGFPLKSAISKALQNLMLSGISGMSAGEKKRRWGVRGVVSTTDTQIFSSIKSRL